MNRSTKVRRVRICAFMAAAVMMFSTVAGACGAGTPEPADVTFPAEETSSEEKSEEAEPESGTVPETTTEEETTEEVTTTEEETTTTPDLPPRILGTKDITVEVGGTVSYKKDVWVEDDNDPFPTLEIDNSQVDLNTVGDYPVTYLATDSAGNVSKVIIQVHVVEPETEPIATEEEYAEMRRLAGYELDECIYDGMSDLEKLWAIFWHVKYNMRYVGDSDKTSWVHEATRGFREGNGDCFTYYSVLKALLEKAGFETVDMTRLGGETRHFWSLVKYKDNWYHIDACPRSPDHGKYWYCFLRTDAQVAEFTEVWGEGYYYIYDMSLSPRTPEESLHLNYDINGEGHEGYDEDYE